MAVKIEMVYLQGVLKLDSQSSNRVIWWLFSHDISPQTNSGTYDTEMLNHETYHANEQIEVWITGMPYSE